MPRICPDQITSAECRRLYQAMLRLLDKPAAIKPRVVVRPCPGPGLELGPGCVLPLWLARNDGLLECLHATRGRQVALIAAACARLNDAHDFDREIAVRVNLSTARSNGYWDEGRPVEWPDLWDAAGTLREHRELVGVVERLKRALVRAADEGGESSSKGWIYDEVKAAEAALSKQSPAPGRKPKAAKAKPKRRATKRGRKSSN